MSLIFDQYCSLESKPPPHPRISLIFYGFFEKKIPKPPEEFSIHSKKIEHLFPQKISRLAPLSHKKSFLLHYRIFENTTPDNVKYKAPLPPHNSSHIKTRHLSGETETFELKILYCTADLFFFPPYLAKLCNFHDSCD